MGDVRRQGLGANVDAVPEHLVSVSSFFVDRYEYTVGRYRDALARGFTASVAPPNTQESDPKCSLPVDPEDPTRDAFPLNCVHPNLAAELCALEGKRLPTEAEWEWIAGNTTDERLFPWGDVREEDTTVRDGPGPVGSRMFDEAVGVRDLAWNVSEWMADDFQTYVERCWVPGSYGVDPICISMEDDVLHGRSVRGGYWMQRGDPIAAYLPMAPNRQVFAQRLLPQIGFRCARDD
jgi:formylglycine-generating enzyme required for sulfatase activity